MLDKRNWWSGIFFLSLGLFLVITSMRLSVWSEIGPNEGFFPLMIGMIIIGLSVNLVRPFLSAHALRRRKIESETEEQSATPRKEVNVFRVVSYALLMLLYAVSMEKAGFLFASAIFLLLILKGVERQSWKITVFVGLITLITSYLLFFHFLRVSLPRGFIPWF